MGRTVGVAGGFAARGEARAVSTSRVAIVVVAFLCAPVLVVVVGVTGAVALLLAVLAAAMVRTEILRQRIPSVGETAAVARPDPHTDLDISWAPPSAGTDPVTAVSEMGPAGLTDEELCWAWRRSFARLTQASGPNTVNHLARLRGHYLDELERRNPRGFAAWMGSGARAASDPAPFFLSVR